MTHISYDVYMQSESIYVSSVLSKLKGFGSLQAITYTVKVAMSWKWCRIVTFLLQTTYRKWYMTYWITVFLMTLTFKVIHLLQASKMGFLYSCAAVDKIWIDNVTQLLCSSWASYCHFNVV